MEFLWRASPSLLAFVLLAVIWGNVVQSKPNDPQCACGGSLTWIRGNPYNQMNVRTFSTSATGCVLSVSPNVASYTPGQQFTVTATASSSLMYKVELTGGGTLAPKSGGSTASPACINFSGSSSRLASVTLTAPSQGEDIVVKALCGTENVMYITNEVRLLAGAGVLPPADKSGVSSDPNYAYQTRLVSGFLLRHSRNGTHAKFRAENTGGGYISIGLGNAMIGSTVLVGVNTASNAGMAAVTLYNIISKTGTIGTAIASGATLANYGIVGASFSVVAGVSAMEWTMVISAQNQNTFYFVKPVGTTEQLIWAIGPAQYVQHTGYGFTQNFEPGAMPSTTTVTPGSATGTVSTDPNYAFQTSLGGSALIQYKKNDTHIKFKVHMDAVGYLSFGPGTVMIGSTVLIGMDPASNPGSPAVGLYTLKSKTGSGSQVNTNIAVTLTDLATYGIVDTSFVVASGTSELKFALELAKQKPEFTLYPAAGVVDAIWALGGSSYALHSSYGYLPQMNFATGTGGAGAGTAMDTKLAAHIGTMILAWEIFSPFGVVLPLFNNAKHGMPGLCRMSAPSWLKYHWILLSIGVVFGFIGTATAYLYVDGKGSAHWSSSHKMFGLVMVVCSVIQPLWGFLRPAKGKTGASGKRALRTIFEYGHPMLGYVLVFGGLANSLSGVDELYRVFGGQDYVFGGIQGSTGFTGAMGMVIVILAAVFMIAFLIGFYRSFLHYQYGRPSHSNALAVADEKQLSGGRTVARGELQAHASERSCWVVHKSCVYDVTEFLPAHPGGKKAILPYAGKDMTEAFNNIGHSQEALGMLSKYLVGTLEGGAAPQQQRKDVEAAAMPTDPNKFLNADNTKRRTVKVTEKTAISPNVFMIKFALPTKTMTLGLPTGKHVCLYGPNMPGKTPGRWNGKPDSEAGKNEISRKYTPVSCDQKDIGYFTLVIKCYRRSEKFPDGGKMGRYLDSLKVGDSVEMAGPFGGHQYLGNGRFVDSGRELKVSQIAMIAGGSGITPIWQIARAMLMDPRDPCKISIVYANSTMDDILMKTELDDLEKKYPNRVRIWYTISQDPKGKPWQYSVGRITKDILQKRFPPPTKETLVITCGPPSMVECAAGLLAQLGYPDNQRIDY